MRGGGAVVSLRDGFYVLDFVSGTLPQARRSRPPGNTRTRMNDGKVDRQGRFVAGYMDYEERDPICALFRLDPTGAVATLDDGIVCSNGPCWSPDGRTFYFADTYTREIWAYDYDIETEVAANRHVFCSFAAAGLKGLPDGATVDSEGFVWSVSAYVRASSSVSGPTASSTGSLRASRREHNQPKVQGPRFGCRLCDFNGAAR